MPIDGGGHTGDGVSVSAKINRGAFPAWFMFAVLRAIGAHTCGWRTGPGRIANLGALALAEAPKSSQNNLYCDETGNAEGQTFSPPPFWFCHVSGVAKPQDGSLDSIKRNDPSRDFLTERIAGFRGWLHCLDADSVAFCTLGLWIFTVLLWLSTPKAVSEASDAITHAQAAANAATRQARPHGRIADYE